MAVNNTPAPPKTIAYCSASIPPEDTISIGSNSVAPTDTTISTHETISELISEPAVEQMLVWRRNISRSSSGSAAITDLTDVFEPKTITADPITTSCTSTNNRSKRGRSVKRIVFQRMGYRGDAQCNNDETDDESDTTSSKQQGEDDIDDCYKDEYNGDSED